MAANFNRVILAGNLTRDPQLSYTPSNTPVCEFGMAINRRWRDRDGNSKEEVCYVDLICYGPRAETINKYMNKGQPIMVEGRLRFRKWTDKEGQNRSKLDVFVENFTFIGGASGRTGGGTAPQNNAAPYAPGDPVADGGSPVGDEDIPF